ncbi:MAG TPA: hypothetical protein VNN74_03190 [Candidatus Micrarchaeia archaeon]|nr:hypothetical protein [Candidatus Micrarchaeia archaeon]
MPDVVVSFLDGEVLYGTVPALQMEDPFLDLAVENLGSNARRALIPLTSLRQILVGGNPPVPSAKELERLPRVALRFTDGQVERAFVATPARLQRFGAVWDLVDPAAEQRRLVGVPYTAIKAAFYIRHWDSRPPARRRAGPEGGGESDQLASVHAARLGRRLGRRLRLPEQGLLERLRGSPAPTAEAGASTADPAAAEEHRG